MTTRHGDPANGEQGEAPVGEPVATEPRWPVALAISCFIALTVTLHFAVPDHPRLGPGWLIPAVEIGMLGLLLAADPARIASGAQRRRLRRASVTLVLILAAAVLASTAKLIDELIRGTKVTQSASSLLASGALVWLGNVLIFGLLYWLLDSGGPVARYRRERPYPDFAFPQQLSPELAPAIWRPRYVDYLVLGLTTSTAFSPTDVMPMRAWAKLTMALQSIISLVLIGLVVARAVNVFS
jgi:uncharacterized membrane protein